MLNLRQLNKTEHAAANSDAQHFSRLSINLGVTSDLLGNISAPLDLSQSERLHKDTLGEREEAAEESEADLESVGPVAGPSGTHWEDEDRSSVSTEGADAGSLVIRWDNSGRTSPESAMLGTGAPGTCGDEASDASHAFGYMDSADTRIDNLTEEVHLSLCSYCCSPRLRTIFFAGGEDQR